MASDQVKLERERRKTAAQVHRWDLQKQLLDILGRKEVLNPLMGVGGAMVIQKLGHSRIINRDYAGFCLAAWTAYCAANAGITDKYALGAITAAATAAYSVSTPPTSSETLVELNMSKLLGGDCKLFWWDLSWLPGVSQLT